MQQIFAATRVGLPIHVSPHSLRHAGPSHDAWFFKDSLDLIQARGRWLCKESVRRYSKPAGMLRTAATLTIAQKQEARRISKELPRAMQQTFAARSGRTSSRAPTSRPNSHHR